MTRTLIVGFGRAGRDLHLRCLVKAGGVHSPGGPCGREIGIVEPEEPKLRQLDVPNVHQFRSLGEACREFGPDTVVHVCTPPATHLSVLRSAAEYGYRRLIVEKPLVDRVTDLNAVRSLAGDRGLGIFVVANWLTSSLTRRLKQFLDANGGDQWLRMTISQLKPRFSHTLASRSHETAFDVEIPHQVALSLYLAGQDTQVRTASCSEMRVNGTRVPHMGAATITLEDTSSRIVVLHSDLTAPIRQRSVEIVLRDGRTITGYYPASETDNFSQLFISDGSGGAGEREVFADDPLSAFFAEVYGHFAGTGLTPVSDVQFNASVVSTISRAKAFCGLQN